MKRPAFLQRLLRMSLLLACLLASLPSFAAQTPQVKGETIVLIRHGEKPAGGLGQLTCKGLNRALALSSLLIARYGKPDFIYAPNPSVQVNEGHGQPTYSYVRPLATIEPTAIRLGMPVNTQIGFDRIDELQQALLEPAYAHSLIFVAWEHIKLFEFARQMLQSHGTGPGHVPDWPNSDYETIYVFHITRTGKGGTPQATLEIQKEDLGNTLKDTCPGPQ
ncbi:MAG: histidine phosphatase family protein [Terriglobia bacterium]